MDRLKDEFSVYMVRSGRINVAGMTPDNMDTTIRIDEQGEIEVETMVDEVCIPVDAMLELLRKAGRL